MGKVSLSHQKREEREAERPTPAPAGPDTHRAWQRLLVPKATSGSPCRAADHSSRARCVCSRGGLTEARLATEPETGAEYGPRTVPRIMFPGPTGGQVSGQEDAPSAPAGLPSRPAPRGRTSGSEPPATAEVPETLRGPGSLPSTNRALAFPNSSPSGAVRAGRRNRGRGRELVLRAGGE
ncbi:uncharacterized protein LOC126083240 isoform X5 [Elephas maximus indicus]|uniref:uncharacterized protein LOC126083240 isoform X5 n=1 Tax=Elephas maximus indicus TaxID=99487 RepID=UPI0021163779|nr:uncharacterized protein LOC126083240 isoform X5 [Elephas maximus indicus]